MKAIQCELCGSNDVIKQDGVFICQYCGTKYTLEEARKMMIEGTVSVTGTVQIDDSGKTSNLIKLAREAFTDCRFDSVYSLCSDALATNPNNAELIAMQGLAVLGKEDFISEVPSSSVNALSRFFAVLKPDSNFIDNATTILNNIEDYLLSVCNFKVQDYDLRINELQAQKMPMDISVEEAESNLRWSKAFVSFAGSDAAHAQLAAAKNNELFNKKIEREQKKLREKSNKVNSFKWSIQKQISEARTAIYWDIHAEEKAAIDNELVSLNSILQELHKRKDQSPSKLKINEIDAQIKELNDQYDVLSVFKFKEKKAIENKIEMLRFQRGEHVDTDNEYQAEISKEIYPLRARIRQLEEELSADPRNR